MSWTPDDRFEPIPDHLRELLDFVIPDFQRPTAIDVLVGYQPPLLVLSEPGEPGSAGFLPSAEDRWLVVQFADWLQDQFFPETAGAWGQARPACPGHRHPMNAEEIAGSAWWVCPTSGQRIAMIGQAGKAS
jgi:hypothetical protein